MSIVLFFATIDLQGASMIDPTGEDVCLAFLFATWLLTSICTLLRRILPGAVFVWVSLVRMPVTRFPELPCPDIFHGPEKLEGREKGTSLNSTCLTSKPLAPSVYVHVPEAHSPDQRSISVMSPFPPPGSTINQAASPRQSLVRTEWVPR